VGDADVDELLFVPQLTAGAELDVARMSAGDFEGAIAISQFHDVKIDIGHARKWWMQSLTSSRRVRQRKQLL